jgi:ectoine hydroxylase-related dioxygenase (phytanoyl-CoA dioxygenase family)
MLNFVVDSEIYLQSDATGATMLTLKSEFAARGYVVQKGVLVGDELEALRAEADRLRAESAGSTQDPGLSAAGDVLCIEFPHKTSAVFHAMLSHPRIVDVLTEIIGANVKCMESMLFLKPGGHPGQAWHQDEAFIPTRDRSLLTTWIALDDATVENGCLWVVPGSQRPAVIWPQEPTSVASPANTRRRRCRYAAARWCSSTGICCTSRTGTARSARVARSSTIT